MPLLAQVVGVGKSRQAGSHGSVADQQHGIGIDKIDELAHYRSKVELDTMRALKRALDPKNIMNPGKILRL